MSLRNSALSLCVVAAVCGSATHLVYAQQDAASEVPNAARSSVGEVSANNVNVRSGPADSHYITTQLSKGDQIIVVGHRYDWLKILPPKGSFSYVAKTYVDRDATGASGTVNRNGTAVRAGSDRSPHDDEIQTVLAAGAKVSILGEKDGYFKVVPPEGAYLYVNKQFVTPVREATARDMTPPAEPQVTVAAPAPTTGATVAENPASAEEQAWQQSSGAKTTPPADAATPRQTVDANVPQRNLVAEAQAQFTALETQFDSTRDKPIEDLPLADLRSGYEQLATNNSLSATQRQLASTRAAYLAVLEKRAEVIRREKQERADFAARQAELDQQARELEQRLKTAGISSFTAVGRLEMSSLSRENQPLMRLVDPADGRTLVYVKFTDLKQKTLLDKFVGVRGELARDVALGVDVIEPSDVEQIDPARVFKGVSARIYPPSLSRNVSATSQPAQ